MRRVEYGGVRNKLEEGITALCESGGEVGFEPFSGESVHVISEHFELL